MSQLILKQQIGDRVQASIQSAVGYLDLITNNVNQMSFLISTDKEINEVFGDVTSDISNDSLYKLRIVQQQFSTILNVNRMVQEMSILHGKTGNTLSNESGIVHFDNVYEQAWYQEAVQANGGLIVYLPDEAASQKSAYWKNDRIYFIRIMDPYNLNISTKDLIFTAIPKSVLVNIVKPLISSSNTEMNLLYKGKSVIRQETEVSSKESKLLTFTSGAIASDWQLSLRQSQTEILQDNYQIRNFTYVIMLVSIVLAFIVSLFVYSGISKPLFRLSSQLKQLAMGNLNAYVAHQRKDELGYVMNAFNTMASKQKQLIEDGYEKELRLAKSKFRLLQSQINPHFLYNTLDCMYSISEEHEVHEVSEMVMNLAKFFRVSLGKGRELFSVEETVEHLMYYIRVQQMRLADRFTVNVDIEPEAQDVPLMRLLLQPLIENAIVHGLENRIEQGNLNLRFSVKQSMLHIEIEDTGIGLKEDVLQELNSELDKIEGEQIHLLVKEDETVTSQFFALKNVKSRMKLYYGKQAQFQITSNYGEGAKVMLQIPVAGARTEGEVNQ